MPVAVVDRRRLTVDPARAWAYLADFDHLAAWAGAASTDWSGDLPALGDGFGSIHRLGPVRYRLRHEVVDWEAGCGFRLKTEGLPAAQDVEIGCRLDAYVEAGRPAGEVVLSFRGTCRPALAGIVVWRAGRRLRRALRRLGRALR